MMKKDYLLGVLFLMGQVTLVKAETVTIKCPSATEVTDNLKMKSNGEVNLDFQTQLSDIELSVVKLLDKKERILICQYTTSAVAFPFEDRKFDIFAYLPPDISASSCKSSKGGKSVRGGKSSKGERKCVGTDCSFTCEKR